MGHVYKNCIQFRSLYKKIKQFMKFGFYFFILPLFI